MNFLFLDIETRPNLAYVWRLWKDIISPVMLQESTSMICYAAKFKDEDVVYKMHEDNDYLTNLWEMMDRADVIVHWNGKNFDIPHINREFLEHGMEPPSFYKQIDLMQVAKKVFRFPSNKLEYVSKQLGVGEKLDNEGFKLWLKCMDGDPEAWANMKTYNIQDCQILEGMYQKLLAWIPGHPNQGLYREGDLACCPKCGDTKIIRKGFAYTNVSKFQQYKCHGCGGWSRGRVNLKDRTALVTNIADG